MKNNKINYIKINIFPDGGISRFKNFWNQFNEITLTLNLLLKKISQNLEI